MPGKNRRHVLWPYILAFLLLAYFALKSNAEVNAAGGEQNMPILFAYYAAAKTPLLSPLIWIKTLLPLDKNCYIIPAICYLAFATWLYADREKTINMRPKVEHGSAGWNKSLKAFHKKYAYPPKTGRPDKSGSPDNKNMLLSDEVYMSLDTHQTMRNNNVLVVGGSGSGKSRFFVKPNILQANCSFVVTDPSGELLESTGEFLRRRGYKIKVFNLVNMELSNHYNPFDYIRNDEGVAVMVNTLIKNTTPPNAGKGDPFWEKSEVALLQAICFYLFHECSPEQRTFANVMKLIRQAEVKEDNPDYKSPLDIIFERLEESKGPSHIAVRQYKVFKAGAGKTLKSILISVSVRLTAFNLVAVENLTSSDNIKLEMLGDEKTALFVVIPAADDTFNFLVAMMYSQLFETLYYHAEADCKQKRLPLHVRFLLDEFANIGCIPDFDKKLATMRKYEISCTIILQNLAQLKAAYKDSKEVIIGNCDEIVFLGSPEIETCEYFQKKLGKETIVTRNNTQNHGNKSGGSSEQWSCTGRELMTTEELSRMDYSHCIVFVRGERPFYTTKYDYTAHPNYKHTFDCSTKNAFDLKAATTTCESLTSIPAALPGTEQKLLAEHSMYITEADEKAIEIAVKANEAAQIDTELRERTETGQKLNTIEPASVETLGGNVGDTAAAVAEHTTFEDAFIPEDALLPPEDFVL